MKFEYYLFAFCVSLVMSCGQKHDHPHPHEEGMHEEHSNERHSKMNHPDSVLRHVVMFSFKETASAEDIQKVVDAFGELPTKIPQIHSYEWGTNNSPEGLNKGLTHCFLLTFLSEADREVYLPHPDHKAFGAMLGPVLEDVTVVDYWTK